MTRRRLTILAAVLALAVSTLAGAAVVNAGLQNPTSCVGDTSTVQIWENGSGDTSDGNDSFMICSQEIDLALVNHVLPGNCADGLLGKGTWNDCVSSATVRIPSGYKACFYRSHDYQVLLSGYGSISGPTSARYTFTGFDNDNLSSVKIKSSGSC